MPSLSMPLFVSPEDVILRMQLGSELTGVNEVISSGIIGAQLHVQRIIDGKLSRQSQDCMFHVMSDAFSGIQSGGAFRLEVPSGFIRRDTPVVLTYSTEGTPFGTFEEIDSDYVKVDYDRGYILLSKDYMLSYLDTETDAPVESYVRVQCDTGFENGLTPWPITGLEQYDYLESYTVGDLVKYNDRAWRCIVTKSVASPPELAYPPTDLMHWAIAYVPMEQIPVELYEAVMAMVPVIFDISQTTNRNSEAKNQYERAADHAALLLQPYVRTMGFSFRPMWK